MPAILNIPEGSPIALGLANTALILSLLDHLFINKKLSGSELGGILGRAEGDLRANGTPLFQDAASIVADFQSQFFGQNPQTD